MTPDNQQQQPVTRADLDQLKTELIEAFREVETNLLKAFHGWARPTEIRLRGTTTAVQGFDERLALLEERVSDIERGRSARP